MSVKKITIIGGGLSGTLLALNLIKHPVSTGSLRITQIDKGKKDDLGPAYSTKEDYLLLNVPALIMGVSSDDPEGFLKWARAKGMESGEFDFLPRQLYRHYILSQFNEVLQKKSQNISFKFIQDEVIDVQPISQEYKVVLKNGQTIESNKIVLALGNFTPRAPSVKDQEFLQNERYHANPWEPNVLSNAGKDDIIFLIGTGQTMTDLVIALHNRGHRGKIIAISRRGYLPMVHGDFKPYPSFFEEIEQLDQILDIAKVIRKHYKKAEAAGMDRRSVIDALRPHTQQIWLSLPVSQKRLFMSRFFRFWEIIRSRIPPESGSVLQQLMESGQLNIDAGSIKEIKVQRDGFDIQYTPKGEKKQEKFHVNQVINCIGAEGNYEKIDAPMIKNLLSKGLITPDPVHLGMDATTDGAIIGKEGTVSQQIFTLGPAMKGILWESLATPEIRLQAEQLAKRLME